MNGGLRGRPVPSSSHERRRLDAGSQLGMSGANADQLVEPGTRRAADHAAFGATDSGRVDVRRVRIEALADAWADAEADATRALMRWNVAVGRDRQVAFVAYVAAVDREQQAALVLAAGVEAQR